MQSTSQFDRASITHISGFNRVNLIDLLEIVNNYKQSAVLFLECIHIKVVKID